MTNRSAFTDDEFQMDFFKACATVAFVLVFVVGFLKGCA